MQKLLPFLSLCLLGWQPLLAQLGTPLTPARIVEIQQSAIGTIQSYSDVLARLARSAQDTEEKKLIRQNLLTHTFVDGQVMLLNDLGVSETRKLRAEEFLRKVSQRRHRYQLRYEPVRVSDLFYDADRERYVMHVEVIRELLDGDRAQGGRRTQYVYLENVRGVPLIYGTGLTPLTARGLVGGEDHSPTTPSTEWQVLPEPTSSCDQTQAETANFLRRMISRDATEIDQGDLLQVKQLDEALQAHCQVEERRDLQRQLVVLAKDVEAAEKAEAKAHHLSARLRREELAELSRRRLRRYMRRVEKARNALVPQVIQRPQSMIDRKTREYQALAHWRQSAVRHPHIQIKAGMLGSAFVDRLDWQEAMGALPYIYKDQWFAELGWRFNRLSKIPREPNPRTGKRHLKRAHVLSLRYQQTFASYDWLDGYQATAWSGVASHFEFQEVEISMVWWEWWRMGAGLGQQRYALITGPVTDHYTTLSSSIALRMLKIFEVDLGCTALLGLQSYPVVWRPQAGVSVLLKL